MEINILFPLMVFCEVTNIFHYEKQQPTVTTKYSLFNNPHAEQGFLTYQEETNKFDIGL